MVPCKRQRLSIALSFLAALMIAGGSPAYAHEEHRRQRAAALKAEQMHRNDAVRPGPAVTGIAAPAPMHAQSGEIMSPPKIDRSKMRASARLLDWIGRLHPVIVHFPIAFLPAAFFTAIVGRRRPAYAEPVKFLTVAGGVIAPVAAVLGWIDGGFTLATDDRLLSIHRWFGTVIGAGALALAIWAIRKPEQNRGAGMIVGLGVMTTAIVLQGWLGGSLTRGLDHMNW